MKIKLFTGKSGESRTFGAEGSNLDDELFVTIESNNRASFFFYNKVFQNFFNCVCWGRGKGETLIQEKWVCYLDDWLTIVTRVLKYNRSAQG